jgi:hypothetical protein
MNELDLLVLRRGFDPAAETTGSALRDLLGADVTHVERGELWRFTFATPDPEGFAAWRAPLVRAACRVGRYVNSNRDACAWWSGSRPYPEQAPPGGAAVDLWVCDGDGEDRAAAAYFRRQTGAPLGAVRRGILWRLCFPGTDLDAARERAADLAVTRSRRHGLLSNPHAQRAELLGAVCDLRAKETP